MPSEFCGPLNNLLSSSPPILNPYENDSFHERDLNHNLFLTLTPCP